MARAWTVQFSTFLFKCAFFCETVSGVARPSRVVLTSETHPKSVGVCRRRLQPNVLGEKRGGARRWRAGQTEDLWRESLNEVTAEAGSNPHVRLPRFFQRQNGSPPVEDTASGAGRSGRFPPSTSTSSPSWRRDEELLSCLLWRWLLLHSQGLRRQCRQVPRTLRRTAVVERCGIVGTGVCEGGSSQGEPRSC